MRVVVVTPNDSDRGLVEGFLGDRGVATQLCTSLAELGPSIGAEVGCIVVVEEALHEPELEGFHEALRGQAPWSDVPLLLIAAQGSSLAWLSEAVFPESGNVTLLQRPLHPVALVSAVNTARRARQRQRDVRDLLEQRVVAVRQRDEFLAMLAHELRNPLAPIRNAVYLLKTLDVPDPLFAKCRGMIEKQTRHITRLVDDLLDVSRLELGKVDLRLQTVDLNQSVSAAVEACVPMTTGQGHVVTVRLAEESLPIHADPVRIEQVLGNLIVNASKYTPPGGVLTIESSRDGAFGRVSVSDNGQGIAPEMLGAVFDLFVQVDNSLARTGGGLGIGLTLVRRLVELHGGSVSATSEGPGKGSRFEVRFPLEERRSGDAAAASIPRRAHKPQRVLIVEDGADIRESLGLIVAHWRHEVIYATTGPEGVALAHKTQPDVALIDIGLPGLNGYEVARQIRGGALPWSRRVKLVALTGYGQTNDRDRALEAGFDEHLLKPVEPALLEQLLLG
jgi:signal transduction histidine kinase